MKGFSLKHEMLSEKSELAGCVDQLSMRILSCMEAVSRYLQHLQHEVQKKVSRAHSGDSSKA